MATQPTGDCRRKHLTTFLALGTLIISLLAMPAAAQMSRNIADLERTEQAINNPTRESQSVSPGPLRGGETIKPAGGDILLSPQENPVTPFASDTPENSADSPQPFGADLFGRATQVSRTLGINPVYQIAPGDKIAIQIWGAQSASEIFTVDLQGNIFLPEVGPVRVAGLPQSQLNATVNKAVSQVYTDRVQVYTNLLNTQPVGIYVTGAVPKPGRYAGERSDSVLYYLGQAGGVDLSRGSFRSLHILRNGRELAAIDLYDFLLKGSLPILQFQDNDTIVVGPINSTVTVSGEVRNEYRFEILEPQVSGAAILEMAKPLPSATHVAVRGVRQGQPLNTYVTLETFRHATVHNGDVLHFQSDMVGDTIFVSVIGQDSGPSTFAVPKGAKLNEVLNLIAVEPKTTALGDIYLRRASVAERQKRALELSLEQLQRAVLTTQSSTPSEAQIRAQEASLVERFVEQARAVEPEGRVVLAGAANQTDLRLEEEDVIVIPQKSNLVMVSGEVNVPQTLLFRPDMDVEDYVQGAGGFTERAEDDKFIIMRQSGKIVTGSNPSIEPGDHVMVMPTAGDKSAVIFKDIVEIIYRIAVSTGVVVNILDD